MSAEKQKMLAGELYNGSDPELANERLQARLLLKRYNDAAADQQELRRQLLKELIPSQGVDLWI